VLRFTTAFAYIHHDSADIERILYRCESRITLICWRLRDRPTDDGGRVQAIGE
jgi:hypothetical protein